VRQKELFVKEPVARLAGLTDLTAPGADDGVGAIVDVVVVGAHDDGKTQFLSNLIWTLAAQPPAGLSPGEEAQSEHLRARALDPKNPHHGATPVGKVRHYVRRVAPGRLLAGLPVASRLLVLLRAGAAWIYAGLAVVAAAVAFGVLALVRHGLDAYVLGGAGLAAALGLGLAFVAAARDLAAGGEIEVVFWDVAGEDVYTRGASDLHRFLCALVAARMERAAARCPYGFAPILICNPLAVGESAEDSTYARLRSLMPEFACIHRHDQDVLVVVNRWVLVRALCGRSQADPAERVAVLAQSRSAPAPEAESGAPPPLPTVQRAAVIGHCRDGDPAVIRGTRFRLLHVEAGLEAQARVAAVEEWARLPEETRARHRLPDGAGAFVHYTYAEGVREIEETARAELYRLLAGLIWPWRPGGRVPAVAETEEAPALPSPDAPSEQTLIMYGKASGDASGGLKRGT
jgi:hypothetical protein